MGRRARQWRAASRWAARACSLTIAAATCLGLLTAVAAAQPTPTPPQVIDGPSPAIAPANAPTGLTLSIARDGTGGLVYLKQSAGVDHVFLVPLQGGSFLAPVQLDAGFVGPSAQPVIAAGNNGALIVAFVNAGNLYITQRGGAATGMSTPRVLAAGGQNPSLQMTNFGKAYLAFTVPDAIGTDVRVAYYYAGTWATESGPLNEIPADNAGSGSGRPAVAAAGDGVAIVAWGENGHVYTRRVWGTSPSIVTEQADAAPPGCSEVSADEPAIGSGGDSSYAAVAFHETLSCGGQQESRVLGNRLHGSVYDGLYAADGLSTPTGDGADQPQVVASEFGTGWITSDRTGSFSTGAQWLRGSESPGGTQQLNTLTNASSPDAVPALAGFYSSLIAWQHDPGSGGQPEIRVRFADSGGTPGPEIVLSSPAQGPTDAAAGLTAAGNVAGEAAAAWVQTTPAGNEIVAEQLYQAPGTAPTQGPTGYVRTTQPTLSWAPSSELWGPVTYTITVDGVQTGQTQGTSLKLPAPLAQGPHTWQTTVTNRAGLTSGTRSGKLFVDTIPPVVSLQLLGARHAGALLHLHVLYTDSLPPLTPAQGSGVAKILVRWGDRLTEVIHHWRYHIYKRPGRYRITVIVVDRAGNRTQVTLLIKVTAPTKAKPKPKKHGKPGKSKDTSRPRAKRLA